MGQYPPGSAEGDIGGVDLALVAGDVGRILGDFFIDGRLDDVSRTMLPYALASLEQAVPLLVPPGRGYFEEALSLLRAVDAAR
jgi:hypothetical protein